MRKLQSQQLLGIFHEAYSAAVQPWISGENPGNHFFRKIGDFINEMGGDHKSAAAAGKFIQKHLVKFFPAEGDPCRLPVHPEM